MLSYGYSYVSYPCTCDPQAEAAFQSRPLLELHQLSAGRLYGNAAEIRRERALALGNCYTVSTAKERKYLPQYDVGREAGFRSDASLGMQYCKNPNAAIGSDQITGRVPCLSR